MYTHYFSSHPHSTKRGILISLFLRAHRLCDDIHIPGEIKHIRSTFLKLQYPSHVINQAMWTAKDRFHNPITRPARTASHHLSLPYHPALVPLRPKLASIGVSTSFSSGNTLRSQLSRTGPIPSKVTKVPGVYKVNCKQCPAVYFGETGRNVGLRRTEHKQHIKKSTPTNALVVHMQQNRGHEFDLKGMEILYKSNQKPKRQLVESSCIASSSNKCNIKPGDFPTCRLTAPIVINSLKLQSKTTNSFYSPPQVPAAAAAPPLDIPSPLQVPAAASPLDIPSPPQVPAAAAASPLDIPSPPQVPATTPIVPSVPAQIPLPIINTLPLLPTAPTPAPRPLAPATPHQAPQTPPRSISYQLPAHISPMLQSQARALLSTPSHLFSLAPTPTPPVAMRTRMRRATQLAPWSPYPSPSQRQGVRRKQRPQAKPLGKAARMQPKVHPAPQSSAKPSLVSARLLGKADMISVTPPAPQTSGNTSSPAFPEFGPPVAPTSFKPHQRKCRYRSQPYDLAATRR